ncbi:DUF1007 family protein [Telmatospirillum sp. J64-1]|uniref:DUF1007 family protein n=1 Tax=Telmatospirillum sp. J64-1 TaxID=2502183 RepID=UPI00163DD44A|nr:DUF1007 family protein [Telmatospirillum sp. J64-1]
MDRTTRCLAALAACLWLGLFPARPALAHPHVFIDTVTTLHFTDGKISALGMQWRFDPMFSSALLGDFDTDGNGRIEGEELEVLKEEAFRGLDELDYFTDLRVDGERVTFKEVEDFRVSVAEGVLAYEFTLHPLRLLDPWNSQVSVSIYDESYYIDIMPDEHDPIRFAGSGMDGCRFALGEDRNNLIFLGLIAPQKADILCGTP